MEASRRRRHELAMEAARHAAGELDPAVPAAGSSAVPRRPRGRGGARAPPGPAAPCELRGSSIRQSWRRRAPLAAPAAPRRGPARPAGHGCARPRCGGPMLQDDTNETERVPFLGPPLLATQNGCSVCLCCWRPFLLDAASILGMGTGMGPLLELVLLSSVSTLESTGYRGHRLLGFSMT